MIRQICPHCLKSVELPDESAGSEVACPACTKSFVVPKPYTPQVDPAAVQSSAIPLPAPIPMLPISPPPPPPPPIDPNRPAPPPGYAPPPGTSPQAVPHYAGSTAMSLSPAVVSWLIPIGLTFILLLTFFPWVGAYPGGVTAYTQSFWGALGNSVTADSAAEQVMKQEANIEKALRSDWWILLPYLLVLLIGVGLAWADRLVTAPDFAYRIGPMGTLRALVWPRRGIILGAIAVITIALFTLESIRGLGLEAAVRTVSTAKYKEEADKVDNTADRQKVRAKVGVEQASFGMQNGYAYWLVGLTHLAVLFAAGGRLWLDARGEHVTPPRVVMEW